MGRYTSRILSLILVAAALLRAWPRLPVLWAIALVDGVALILIWLPDKIDAWSFGTYMRGGTVSSHTPGWMIAAFGWGLLVLMTVLILWPGVLHRVA